MQRIPIDTGWKFRHETPDEVPFPTISRKNQEAMGYAAKAFNDTGWEDVTLPHDWAIELPFDEYASNSHGHRPTSPVYRNGLVPGEECPRIPTVGWYRRKLFIPQEWLGKRIIAEFDGVFRDSRVWINGQYYDRFSGGYAPFRCDLTDNLYYGEENVLVVAADTREEEGWWYEGGGIYRHVRLLICDCLHLDRLEIKVHTDMEGNIAVSGNVINDGDVNETATVCWQLLDGEKEVLSGSCRAQAEAWRSGSFAFSDKLEGAKLWSPDEPNLYRLKLYLRENGDCEELNIGFRTFRFDADEGLFVNEKNVKIKGACIHQDFAGVGVALPDEIHEYKIRKLKEMGCNAYRSSHNIPAPEIVDACDRLGMLLMDETRFFGSTPDAMRSTEALIKRDRNHPCVLMWSIGNEEHSVQSKPVGARLAQSVMRRIRELDDSHIITYGGNNGPDYEGINAEVDVRGVNYVHIRKFNYVDDYHREHPHQPMYGSEEVSIVMTRGEYEGTRAYPPAYGEHAMPWASTAEGWWKYYTERPFLAGGFMWTGFDYFGEPTPYVRNTVTTFGAIDICGFEKDVYYYYQSQWKQEDILHLLPDWNRREGETVRVIVYTNLEEVELLVNGRSYGKIGVEAHDHAEWSVPFEKGCIEAVGYRSGVEVLRAKRATAGAPARLRIVKEDAVDGKNVRFIRAQVCDKDGNIVPYADNAIRFYSDKGTWLGVGNGDPASRERDKFGFDTIRQELIEWTRGENKVPWDAFMKRGNEHYIDHSIAQTMTLTENVEPFRDARRIVYRAAAEKVSDRFDCVFRADSSFTRLDFARLEGNYTVTLNGEVLGSGNAKGYPCSFDVSLKDGENVLSVEVNDVYDAGGVFGGVWLSKKQAQVPFRKAFHGLALGILNAEKGTKVRIEADGLEADGLEADEIII